jgi:NAD(P)-dependent dehydrogenase (short-subunit alcohol dehydrogenase family)
MRGLQGKVAIVTGGGNGIGRACCERFAEEGCDVVVADLLEAAGAQTVESVEALGGRAIFVASDATSAESNDAVVTEAVEVFGGVDVLVTAAGVAWKNYVSGDPNASKAMLEAGRGPVDGIVDCDLDEWASVIDVNLTGTLLAVRSAGRQMVAQGRGGSIVTIASIAAKHPEAGTPAYGVSKAGVWMLTKQAASALASAGIRVNSVGPGFVDTNMTKIIKELGIEDNVLRLIPMGRFGQPSEIASAVAFLASDDASYFTGELIHPDGGFFTD